jgi:RimJ/RimL family protein N-acetyltransferase
MTSGDELYADLAHAFESERLIFRAVENDEVDKTFFMQCFNDPIGTAMGSRVTLKPAGRDVFEVVLRQAKTNMLYVVACLKERQEGEERLTPVGWVTLFDMSERALIYQHRNAMLAVSVAGGYRGKGYGGEMVNWALDWGFRRANLHRVGLAVSTHNPRAERLYRKLGFVEEGRERETTFVNRKWYDTIHFGLLEGDWEKLRGIKGTDQDRTFLKV